ncbi:heparan-alpha-glucosaminide N-acetyltransferase domain-containing protein [Ornithinimicrobium panacihumi]|uniref:heparan-alpha-glucosaminide N-acetyltransferase domain-containing protein n=1 Tax=Ornithinimicrobium panacihumi TaxID=2008449 RepID=UPI003F88C21F
MDVTLPSGSAGGRRVVGIDLARMLALLGMYAAHLTTSRQPDAPGGVDPLFQVVAGRSSALFAVLAGVGIVLASRSAIGRGEVGLARGRLAVRALAVAVIGLVLGQLDSGLAVILTFYGLLFLCAIPVLTWSAGRLAWLAAAWVLVAPVVSLLLRRQVEAPAKLVPSIQSLADPLTLGSELLLTGYYPVLTWAAYLFAGMAVGRLDLHSGWVAGRLAVGGALLASATVAVSVALTSRPEVRAALVADPRRPVAGWDELDTQLRTGFYGTHPTGTPWWLGVWSPHSGSIIDLAHTIGSALLVTGLCLWLVHALTSVPWHVVGGAGAMTLTLYSTHVAVLASPLDHKGPLALSVHSAVSIALGALFAASKVRGPLEQLVTAATRTIGPAGPPRA